MDHDGGRSLVDSSSEPVLRDIDTPPTSIASPASAKAGLPPLTPLAIDKPIRLRRLSRKARGQSPPPPPKARARSLASVKSKQEQEAIEEEAEVSAQILVEESAPSAKAKPKSETYKQAWSVSEQHLLERLLEEIPEGEKNRSVRLICCRDFSQPCLIISLNCRWQKISQAMSGRRTPRQVASRVQKYFEKLKQFGIEVGGSK